MIQHASIFSQLLQVFPRILFAELVKKHDAERHAKGFPSWAQFVAMLYCQLASAKSLREICVGFMFMGHFSHDVFSEADEDIMCKQVAKFRERFGSRNG